MSTPTISHDDMIINERYKDLLLTVTEGKKVNARQIKGLKDHYDFPDIDWANASQSEAVKAVTNLQKKGAVKASSPVLSPSNVDSSGKYVSVNINYASYVKKIHYTNPVFRRIFDKIADSLVDESETDVKSVLSHILKAGQDFMDPAQKFGVARDISQSDLQNWRKFRAKKMRVYGPYMLTKVLHQAKVSFSLEQQQITPGDMLADPPVYPTYADPHVKFSRHGIDLIANSKYILQADTLGSQTEAFASFLADFKYRKKYVLFRPTSREAYDLANIFLYVYDVRCDAKKKELVTSLNPDAPAYDPDIEALIESLRESSRSLPSKVTAVDEIYDFVAGCADAFLTEANREAIRRAKSDAVKYAEVDLKATFSVMDRAYKMRDSERYKYLFDLGITGNPEKTCDYLKACRSIRNRKNCPHITQLIQKNAASAFGPDSVQFVDTALKGANILQYFLNEGGTFDGKDFSLYGVAYNHMGPVVDRLLQGVSSKRSYDLEAAKDSPEAFILGDILKWVPRTPTPLKTEFVLDDTWLHAMAKPYIKANGIDMQLVDLDKVQRFCAKPVNTAVLKVSLKSLVSNTIRNLLLPDPPNTPPYNYVRVMKFGKLHNDEVFLFLSNDADILENGYRRSRAQWDTDLVEVSQCIYMANKCLQTFDLQGVRFEPTMGAINFWYRFRKLMKNGMTWYNDVKFYGPNKLTGGVFLKEIEINETTGIVFEGSVVVDVYAEYEKLEQQQKAGVPNTTFTATTVASPPSTAYMSAAHDTVAK